MNMNKLHNNQKITCNGIVDSPQNETVFESSRVINFKITLSSCLSFVILVIVIGIFITLLMNPEIIQSLVDAWNNFQNLPVIGN